MSRARTVATTELLLVIGLVLFVLVAHAVETWLDLPAPVHLGPLAAVGMSAIPGLLWLTYFYLQDRHEPEPKHFVAGIALLGALVAAPASHFLIELARPAQNPAAPLNPLSVPNLAWSFLTIAAAQELAKYAVVRYTIYTSPEFDEPMDGIVYMTAAGVGFATFENYQTLQGLNGEIFLSTGAMNAVITTLAHACFAGVLGFAMGRAKFSSASARRRSLILLLGFLVAVVLNGQFAVLQLLVKTSGLSVHPWRGLAYAAGFAAVVFFATSLLMRRHLDASPHAIAGDSAPTHVPPTSDGGSADPEADGP